MLLNRFKKMLILKNLELKKENKILRKMLSEVPTYDDYKNRIHELELQLREEKLKSEIKK